ncbi:MAG: hypothetical protein ACERK6_04725 [Candidatus Aminicenantaceae bacterium]
MKKNIKVAFIISWVLLMSFTSASVLIAQAENYTALLGAWDVELTGMGMQMEFIFKMDGETLTGEMNFDMGAAELEDISFEEGKLTFTATVDTGGQTMGIEAEATIEEENITGVMFTEMGEAEFVGTKRKDQ